MNVFFAKVNAMETDKSERARDGAKTPAPETPVARLLNSALYPGGISALGNAGIKAMLWSDSLTLQRCFLRFGGGGRGF